MPKASLILLFAIALPFMATAQTNGNAATGVIGRQEWMAQNLDVVHYWDGAPIPEAKTIQQWRTYNEHKIGCYCNYDNETNYGRMYGKLYNLYALRRGVAPHCWRVATKNDFDKLVANLGNDSAAKKLKATHSWNNDWNGNDNSRFGAFAGGCRNGNGTFSYVGRQGFWWIKDENRSKGQKTSLFFSISFDDKCSYDLSEDFGFSVRCVRDIGAPPIPPCP